MISDLGLPWQMKNVEFWLSKRICIWKSPFLHYFQKKPHQYHDLSNVSFQLRGALYRNDILLIDVTVTPGLCLQLQNQPKFRGVKKLVWVFLTFFIDTMNMEKMYPTNGKYFRNVQGIYFSISVSQKRILVFCLSIFISAI